MATQTRKQRSGTHSSECDGSISITPGDVLVEAAHIRALAHILDDIECGDYSCPDDHISEVRMFLARSIVEKATALVSAADAPEGDLSAQAAA